MPALVVTCIRGGSPGRRWDLDLDEFTIGRRPDNAIALDPHVDRKASGRHARIAFAEGRWLLVDLGSTNGTYVNGNKVDGMVTLYDGINVEFGLDGPVLVFRYDSSQLAPPPTQAVNLSELNAPNKSTGRTGIYRLMMQEAVEESSKRLNLAIAVLAGIIVLGSLIGTWMYFRQKGETEAAVRAAEEARDGQEAVEAELASARTNLANTANRLADLRLEIDRTEGAAKEALEAQATRLETVRAKYETQLRRQEQQLSDLQKEGTAAQVIAKRYEHTLFMLVAQESASTLTGFCTAFAVTRDGLLATNAHCVRAMADVVDRGQTVLARMNRQPNSTYPVTKWKAHPDYADKAFSADVAIIKLALPEGQLLPVEVTLASDDELSALAAGQPVFTMGFPGRVMNEQQPAADFRAAVISRLTDYGNNPGSKATARVVWHSALTSKGTSGSPIFNRSGHVIAVNNGGLSARRILTKDDAGNVVTEMAYDATGLNFGIRVDVLRSMLPKTLPSP